MRKQTVRKRIFTSNAFMILATLMIVLIINVCVVKLYWNAIEYQWQVSMENTSATADIGELLEEWTLHQRSFYVLLFADILVCGAVWMIVSFFFTRNLVGQIMKPLDALEQGAGRIRANELTEEICYQGDREFEEICHAFNDMQAHLLEEQEKNRQYEKARTEMIAGISHDLRTPLTAIRGSIKGILDGVIKEEEQKEKFLQTAYRRTRDMEVLLNQLFYVSKLESGNMPLHMQKTDLFSWISEYVGRAQKMSAGEKIEFTTELEKVSGMAMVDQEQLQRIFDNLLENSIKYGNTESIQIRIALKETEKEFHITFADHGQGVPEEKLEHIFEEFYRADESRNKKEGNGLGLYIVKTLIEAMHGRIWAENRAGLAICIELPKGEAENAAG